MGKEERRKEEGKGWSGEATTGRGCGGRGAAEILRLESGGTSSRRYEYERERHAPVHLLCTRQEFGSERGVDAQVVYRVADSTSRERLRHADSRHNRHTQLRLAHLSTHL